MSELEELLLGVVEKFKAKIAEDEALRKELSDITRTLYLEPEGKEGFSFKLDKGEITEFRKGGIAEPDIRISATEEDLIALFKGELKPMKAWATKRVEFKASIQDLMRLKKFI